MDHSTTTHNSPSAVADEPTPVERYLTRREGTSQSTAEAEISQALKRLERWAAQTSRRVQDLNERDLIEWLNSPRSTGSAGRIILQAYSLIAIYDFYGYLRKNNLISHNPAHRLLPQRIVHPAAMRRSSERSPARAQRVTQSTARPDIQVIIQLHEVMDMGPSEIAALRVDDVNLPDNRLTYRARLDGQQTSPIPESAAEIFNAYLGTRNEIATPGVRNFVVDPRGKAYTADRISSVLRGRTGASTARGRSAIKREHFRTPALGENGVSPELAAPVVASMPQSLAA